MNLENEKIASSVNAPDSYHKEFESRLLQRLGISADILSQSTGSPAINADSNNSNTNNTTHAVPEVQLNPVTPQVEPQKVARKQDPETIKSEAVSKEIDQIGNIKIEPMVVSTNENPEWVNFAATEEASTPSVEGIVKITHAPNNADENSTVVISNNEDEIISEKDSSVNDIDVLSEIEESSLEANSDVPAWNEIVAQDTSHGQVNMELDQSPSNTTPKVVHHVPETLGADNANANFDDAPKETKLYNQSEPGLDTLEPPPQPFAPIAGRVQSSTNGPGWIGIAASLAAIVAAYFIWVAIQPNTEETEKPVVIVPPPAVEAPVVAAVKDTVPAGIRLVENYILDEKLEKYKEPNVFSVNQLEELPEKSKKALNDLEHHNIAVFDMEDVLFEDLDLLIQ